ncbi:MAG: ROK family protein, partial [Acidimicrobiales bacterium]
MPRRGLRGQRRPRRAGAHRRPAAVLSQVPTIGIDLGGTKCLGVVVDESGTVLAERRVPTPDGAAAVLDTVAALVAALAEWAA